MTTRPKSQFKRVKSGTTWGPFSENNNEYVDKNYSRCCWNDIENMAIAYVSDSPIGSSNVATSFQKSKYSTAIFQFSRTELSAKLEIGQM